MFRKWPTVILIRSSFLIIYLLVYCINYDESIVRKSKRNNYNGNYYDLVWGKVRMVRNEFSDCCYDSLYVPYSYNKVGGWIASK